MEFDGDHVEPAFHRCFTGHTGTITSLHFKPQHDTHHASLHSSSPSPPHPASSARRSAAGTPHSLPPPPPPPYEFVSGSADHSLIVWRYTPRLSAYRLIGHTAPITAVRYNPQSTLIASASADGTVRLWDAEVGGQHRHTCHVSQLHAPVYDIDWDSRGDWFIAACHDDVLRAHKVNTTLTSTLHTGSLYGHLAPVTCGQFTPDCLLVCSGSLDQTVRVWDFERLTSLHRYDQFDEAVRGVCVHPQGNVLAVLTDRSVRVLDIRSHMLLQQYSMAATGSTSAVHLSSSSLCFHPAGHHLFSCGVDGLSVMDMRHGRVEWRVHAHESTVTAVSVLERQRQPDAGSSAFISGGIDQRINSFVFAAKTADDDWRAEGAVRAITAKRSYSRSVSQKAKTGQVAGNLAQPSRRDAMYGADEDRKLRSSKQSISFVASVNAPLQRAALSRDRVVLGRGGGGGCTYRHTHTGRQNGRVWDYQRTLDQTSNRKQIYALTGQPPPVRHVHPPPSAADGQAAAGPPFPLLHHNSSTVYRSHHLHAEQVDDLVQRLPHQLAGTLQVIQGQLSAIADSLSGLEGRMSGLESRTKRVDESLHTTESVSTSAAST